ncbi:MAG: prolyl oligopeptidase family serine peptidase [Phycisphaerae bacterium]|nr:prolyl oligopeptidase family serine peptidase [Phycisphaerae bacterium]
MATLRCGIGRLSCLIGIAALAACGTTASQKAPLARLNYPPAKTVEVTDVYHGTTVSDPYRWLEEYSDETNRWIDEEEALARGYLDAIPERAAIKAKLEKLWNYERFGLPEKAGNRYIYSRNDGLQNQSVVYVADSLNGAPRVLIDPNTMSADGTVALGGVSVSDDGKLVACSIAEAGSDWNVIRVRDVETGKDLDDEIRWVKFSSANWAKDGSGFYYSRFDAPTDGDKLKAINEYHKIYYHKIGTPQDADELIFERQDQPRWYLGAGVSDDGRWLIIGIESGDSINNALSYRDLSVPGSPTVALFDAFDAKYSFIGNDGTTFYIRSNLDAPRGRVWAVDVTKPARSNWREVIPQTEDALVSASMVGDQIFCNYLHDARSLVRVHALNGAVEGEVPLPGICTASGFGGKRTDSETFFVTSSFTLPPSIYRYDLASAKSTVFKQPKVAFDGDRYVTKQVFATSKDGTKVPMFITHRKGLRLNGENPTILYGYGGFNIPLTPDFSPVQCGWLELGGVWVEANLRGGGEYGEEWHQGGMRLTKQNTFDDCIACGEWLIANRYTSNRKLAVQGGSNGGLLVGACMTQRPDLWGACLPAVGVLDMLRFQKFTIGWGWVGDYGSSDNADDFKVLHSFSPYHNIKKGVCYPPTLITTGDHDDRVYPAHSFKFAAAMQAAQAEVPHCGNPILIRIEKRAGHGAGKPTSKRIEEATDVYAFLAATLGMRVD